MGCVSSKGDINDSHPNIFQVMNVDEQFQLISPGRIEITDTELVLHQRGKASNKWPLRCLRKYGFDSEIFTFECGRRCQTGAGIYAFQCRKAEQLFNLLQHKIQVRNMSDDINDPAVPSLARRHPPESYLNPTTRPTLSRPGSITSNGPSSPRSPPPLEHNNNKRGSLEHSYLNTVAIEETVSPYVNLNTPVNCTRNTSEIEENARVYMNVNTDSITKELFEPEEHNYANVDAGEIDALPMTSNPYSSMPETPTSLYVTIRDINYAELDLNPGRKKVAQVVLPPDMPVKSPKKSYVTIDFEKTNALSQSINTRIDDVADCSRRTRHNSTIGDVRHSNSISD